ncbi:uncharacterized protein LOC142656020 [Rhinoderma darwinii]|uniref:uncharacterized protein LOC142656020 n=1 Tax=Rhinoderma darwinii TaxID=43563 RepID=UPI003F66E444
MEFLQRHLPRVYQAVQNALDFLTNVTAQVFGAPPDAPQPRNARAKTPLRSEESAARAKQEETRESQGADHMTLAPDASSEDTALEATEESMKIYGIQQDVENQAQKTKVRHRKENVDRELDLLHAIGDGKDSPRDPHVTMEKHKHQRHSKVTIEDHKPTKPQDIDVVSSIIVRKVLQVEVHNVINEEVNQETSVYEEHTMIKTKEQSSTLKLTMLKEELLRDLEPKRYLEEEHHEVPPTSNQVLKSDLDLENGENSCSPSNMNNSPSLDEAIVVHQESLEEAAIYQVTSQDQELPLPGDHLDVPDIKRPNKKLVTPVSEADRSPCDQGEEARKTWEHLQETAVRLARHCDLLQDDDQEFETLGSGDRSKTTHVNKMHSSRPKVEGDRGRHQEKTSHEPEKVKELRSEEKEQAEVDKERDEQDQKVEKMRRRVHFSPSTEERDQMLDLTTEDTVCIKFDLLQGGALETTDEYTGHPPNSYSIAESGQSPNRREENYLGFIITNQDTEPSMTNPTSEEDQVHQQHMGLTVWYHELEKTTDADKETCESTLSDQSETIGFQILASPDKKSLKELSTDVPSVEEMHDNEEEPTKNSMSTLGDIITHPGVDSEVEYHHGGTCSFDKVDGSLQKEKRFGVVSDRSKHEGSNFAEHEGTSFTEALEVVSQSNQEIKVDLLLNESWKQQVQIEDYSEDDDDNKGELLGIWHHASMEETKDTGVTKNEGGLMSRTEELNIHGVSTPDEGYDQTPVQELVKSKNEELQGDILDPSTQIINIESVRNLSTDSSGSDNTQTAEDNERFTEKNLTLLTETQKVSYTQEEDDTEGKEYEDVEDIREVKHVRGQIEEHGIGEEEYRMQEMEDYTWYRQDSYQTDGHVTYTDSNEEPGSQKDQYSTVRIEGSFEKLPDKDSERGIVSNGEKAQFQVNLLQVSGTDQDPTKVNDNDIGSEAEATNTSVSAYPGHGSGPGDEFEGIGRHPEIGFDLLSEIQPVINTSQSEQDISEMMGRSDVTHGAVSSGNVEMEATEGDFPVESHSQTDNVMKDLDLLSEIQCLLMSGHLEGKFSKDLASEAQTSVTPDEASGGQSLDPFNMESLAEDHIEVILRSISDPNTWMDNISEPQDGGDFLFEPFVMSMDHPAEDLGIISYIKVDHSDEGYSNEETPVGILSETITVEEPENLGESSPGFHLSEELESLIELKQTFEEERYSSIGIAVTETEVSDIDPSVEISENKEDEEGQAGEDQSPVTLDEPSNELLGDQHLDIVKAQEISFSTGSPSEDHSEVIVGSISDHYKVETISETLDGGDLLFNVLSEIPMDLSAEVCAKEESDKGVEAVRHSNEEPPVGILSETITVEEHENLEESSPGFHHSEELESLKEPKQTFEEERYSYFGIAVTETEVADVEDVGRSDDEAVVDLLSETITVEEQEDPQEDSPKELGSIIKFKEKFEEQCYSSIVVIETQVEAADINNASEMKSSLELEPSPELHGVLIQDHTAEKISEIKEEEGLPGEDQSSDTQDDAYREQIGDLKPEIPLEIRSLVEDIKVILGSTSELSEPQGEGDLLSETLFAEKTDDPKKDISFASTTELTESGKEDILDASITYDILEDSAVQADFLADIVIPDERENIQNNVSAFSHSEELGSSLEPSQELEENQYNSSSLVSIEDPSIGLDIVNFLIEDPFNSKNKQEPQKMEMLSEVQSVITTDHSVEVTTVISTVKLVESDEDIFPKFITTDEKEGTVKPTPEMCPSEPSEEPKKSLHEQEPSFLSSTTDTHVTEHITGFDIKESSKEIKIIGTTEFLESERKEQSQIKELLSMDHTKQGGMERGVEEQFSNEEALSSGQNKYVITIHTEEQPTLIEPPTHKKMSKDQEGPLVDHKGTLMEPSVEEDDDMDNSMLPHNTLDVSAQKSRVQLRRKTSIRRKQGQRPVTEIEPAELPPPVRPRPMGVPVFPGNMPIFPMAPAMSPPMAHPTEEHREEKPAEEELVKPKKGIPRHAGFGIPHPQMMQELQARLKKKKPNE